MSNISLVITEIEIVLYPAALRRVQITPITSTKIMRYLYSRRPVTQVSSQRASGELDWGYEEKKNKKKTNSACWIINLLQDVLLCSITDNFYSSFVYWLTLQARQSTAQLVKELSDTIRNETSNKI